jgi:PadR family transcriptional regulator, regulatory protein PadR
MQRRINRATVNGVKGEHLGEFEEFTLLAVRALGNHTYAVPVQQYVEKVTSRSASIGAIYAALARLEAKGFLRSAMSEPLAQRGGKSKRLYAVTPKGLQTARQLHRVRERMWKAIAEEAGS